MPAKSVYLDNAIIDGVLRNVPYTPAATVYVALFTVIPTPSTSGTEVVGGTYTRTAVTMSAPVDGVSVNSGVVTFPTATALWGIIVAAAICDDPVAGNILYFGSLGADKTVDVGDTVQFAAAALTVTEK